MCHQITLFSRCGLRPWFERSVREEVRSAHNPARLSPSDPACTCLKPFGFVDTETLGKSAEIIERK